MIEEFKRILADEGRLVMMMHVKPNAAKTEITGFLENGTMKLSVAAPAEEGRGNDVICRFLATTFNVRPTDVKVLSGLKARIKMVRVTVPQ